MHPCLLRWPSSCLQVEEDLGVSQVTSWPGGSACVERVTGTDAFQFAPGAVVAVAASAMPIHP